jgi:PAS domain S-box-containing protein
MIVMKNKLANQPERIPTARPGLKVSQTELPESADLHPPYLSNVKGFARNEGKSDMKTTRPEWVNEELHLQPGFVEALANSALDGVLVMDCQGNICLLNRRFVDLFQLSKQIIEDNDHGKLLQLVAGRLKTPDRFLETVQHLRAYPAEVSREEIKLTDGTILDCYSSPVQNTTGKNYGRIWTCRDITEHRNLEEQLRQAQKMEGIGQLAGGVAHDFNNILAVIRMQTSLLKMEPDLSLEQLRIANEIEEAARRATDFTRQLLLFSRRQPMQMRDLDLKEVVARTAPTLQQVLGEEIQMKLNFAPLTLLAHADRSMLEQLLLNLTVNARDAMQNGGQLTIETSSAEFDAITVMQTSYGRPGSFACLSVSDTGCGIPPEILPRIFEPFFTTKDVGKGPGLGLAAVFGMVQQHKGWIDVYSEVGKGTTFRFYLPRLTHSSGPKAVSSSPASVQRGNETTLMVGNPGAS